MEQTYLTQADWDELFPNTSEKERQKIKELLILCRIAFYSKIRHKSKEMVYNNEDDMV